MENRKMDMSPTDLSTLSEAELIRMERDIARKYMDKLSIPMVIWPILNISCWVALWPLVMTGTLSLWIAFPIALLNITLSYLPSHEAQHDIYARPGQKLRWLNQAIGHISVLPLAFGYRTLRLTHLEHHKHTNKPGLDPDQVFNNSQTLLGNIWTNIKSYQPGSKSAASYRECLARIGTPETERALLEQVAITVAHFCVLFFCAYHGKALEALILWWLPLKMAVIYIRVYLSWLPHFPGHQVGRYKDTRGFKSWGGVWSSLGMTAHVAHHLHPRIPLDKTPAALGELTPILEARKSTLV
jgi:beta-carotene hydroxylase